MNKTLFFGGGGGHMSAPDELTLVRVIIVVVNIIEGKQSQLSWSLTI